MKVLKVIAGTVMLAGMLLAGCDQIPLFNQEQAEPTPIPVIIASPNVIAEGRVMPREYRYLAFSMAGEVSEVLAIEGELVSAGQIVARLGESEAIDAAVKAAQAELLAAQQALDTLNEKAGVTDAQVDVAVAEAEKVQIEAKKALDELDTDAFRDRMDDAYIAVSDADKELQDAQEEVDRYRDLDPDNATRKGAEDALEKAQEELDDAVYQRDLLVNQLTSARTALAAAEAKLADAKREAGIRAGGPDPDEMALAQLRVDATQAQLKAAEAAQDKLAIKAPFDGTLVALDLIVGESILPGQRVALVADLSEWVIETTDLTEMDVVKMEVGNKADVTPDALPDLTIGAKVETISQVFSEQGGDIVYTVRLTLDESDDQLRWGMTVQVEFEE